MAEYEYCVQWRCKTVYNDGSVSEEWTEWEEKEFHIWEPQNFDKAQDSLDQLERAQANFKVSLSSGDDDAIRNARNKLLANQNTQYRLARRRVSEWEGTDSAQYYSEMS